MSVFSNPASGATADPSAYIRALLAELGDDDPIEAQAVLPARVEAALRGLAPADLRRPEKPGKWSILEVLNHLVDTEIVTAWRTRMTVAQDEPAIQSYDQDLWTARLRYNEGDPPQLLDELRVLRGRNVRFARSLSPAERARFGRHEERGPESVDRLLRLIAGHDRVHLKQIERIKRTLGLGASGSAG
jgi:hypothetical protein